MGTSVSSPPLLTPEDACRRLRAGPAPAAWGPRWQHNEVIIAAHRLLAREAIASIPPCPDAVWGRGIVICTGGAKYFPAAWVCASMLRHLGCRLPIQFWHLGERELDQRMREATADLDVTCVDAEELRLTRPARRLGGWELKAYAILHSRFREVILLDADNVPLIDPATLLDAPEYRQHGAIFWPDRRNLKPDNLIWSICEVPYRDEPEFESGQIVVDKRRCWEALNLAMHYNEHSDFYYAHIYGDKDTFHLAFHRTGKSYAMPATGVFWLDGTLCQHDFEGKRILQHRHYDKWRLDGRNRRVGGFLHEGLCLEFLKALRERCGKAAASGVGTARPRSARIQRSAPSPAPLRVFGLQRTCTNLVRRGLMENFEVHPLTDGADWKHGPIGRTGWKEWNGQLPRIVVCVRNPYAWLASCYGYFKRSLRADPGICRRFAADASFGEFIRGEHYVWPSPIARWNELNRHWEAFVAAHPLRAAVVRAEDPMGLDKQARQWARLETALGLARKIERQSGLDRALAAIDRRVEPGSRVTRAPMDFDYYGKGCYLEKFDAELLQDVNAQLDWELMDRFGYERRDGGA